jgi:hypothetical protein
VSRNQILHGNGDQPKALKSQLTNNKRYRYIELTTFNPDKGSAPDVQPMRGFDHRSPFFHDICHWWALADPDCIVFVGLGAIITYMYV